MRQCPLFTLLACAAALVLIWPEAGLAQQNTPGTQTGQVLDSAIDTMKDGIYRVGARLSEIARWSLVSLFVVDLVLRFGRGIFSNDALSDLFRGFAFQLGFVGFIWGVALWTPDIIAALANTALDIANAAGASNAQAGGMVTEGLARAAGWLDEISVLSPGTWFYLTAAAISIIVMAMAVAMLVVTYAELYLAGMAGMVTLMFAGLSETRDIALKYVNSLVGKAFKLMGLMIIVAATGEMTTALATRTGSGLANAMGMITLQIVSAVLIMTLPGTLERLVGSGFSSRAGEMIGKMAGGAMKVAAFAGLGGAGGAMVGASAEALKAAKAGTSGMGIVKAAGQGALTGMRDQSIDWGRATQNKDVMSGLGRKVAQRLGYGNTGGDNP